MAEGAFEAWYVEGLRAVRTAAEQGRAGASNPHAQSATPGVRDIMERGAAVFAAHGSALDALLRGAGAGPGDRPNPFMDGIQKGSQQMIQAAGDAAVREASVVAAAQVATHYFIAAYGTLASNAKHLGREEDARVLSRLADEMKSADAGMTELAERAANRRASSGA